MNSYYIMIHFDGPFVNGFFVPQANDEKDAIKQLKKVLIAKKISIVDRNNESLSNELSFKRINSALRSLKKPWRFTKRSMELVGRDFKRQPDPVVRVMKWNKPLLTGYWLTDCESGQHLCNIQ